MEVVMRTKGAKETEKLTDEEGNFERQLKRLYSFKDLYNLVTLITSKGEVNDRLV